MVRRWWKRPGLVGATVAAAYLVFALLVVAVEWWSEKGKLAVGAYTDTVDALAFGRLVTLPASLGVAPTAKDDLAALNESAQLLAFTALGQALVLGLLVGAFARLDRRPTHDDVSP
jgi:hypothetical protein